MRIWPTRLAAAGRQPAAAAPGRAGTDVGRRAGPLERVIAPALVVGYAVGIPVWSFGRVLAGPHSSGAAVAAAVAMACSVVLQLWLMIPMARARRPRHAGWLIAAFAAINLGAFIVIGPLWFAAGEQLAVMAAVYLPLRWSVPAVAALAAAPAALAFAGRDEALGHYFAQNTVFWPLAVGVLIWLIRAAAELQARQHELADSAVIAERVRIDNELALSLGAQLQLLIAAGERAARTAGDDAAGTERELRALTTASRRALARTRQMVSRYQAATVRSELSTAVALLTAVGVGVRTDVPDAALARELDNMRLAGFRSGLTALLGDDTASGCVITIGDSNGGIQLEIRGEHQVSP